MRDAVCTLLVEQVCIACYQVCTCFFTHLTVVDQALSVLLVEIKRFPVMSALYIDMVTSAVNRAPGEQDTGLWLVLHSFKTEIDGHIHLKVSQKHLVLYSYHSFTDKD